MEKIDLRIVFFGTPDFAVESLKILVECNYNIVAVVTAPDKPAGRGRKLNQSPVKQYAVENNLTVLQPDKLKNPKFLDELKSLHANLQIVVAFRMLPESVWNMPKLGTLNLHASLLPDYRGAAPINHAIINGETKTGITTFFLRHEIDTGDVIFRQEVVINKAENAGQLHDKLMMIGAQLVLKTVGAIKSGFADTKSQSHYTTTANKINPAPKIFKESCKINWNNDTEQIYNFVRGLSPYPTAWSELKQKNSDTINSFKVFACEIEKAEHTQTIGTIISDNKTYVKIAIKEGFIVLTDIQLTGKKRIKIKAFLNGFDISLYELNV